MKRHCNIIAPATILYLCMKDVSQQFDHGRAFLKPKSPFLYADPRMLLSPTPPPEKYHLLNGG
jgi:hypothetical protein